MWNATPGWGVTFARLPQGKGAHDWGRATDSSYLPTSLALCPLDIITWVDLLFACHLCPWIAVRIIWTRDHKPLRHRTHCPCCAPHSISLPRLPPHRASRPVARRRSAGARVWGLQGLWKNISLALERARLLDAPVWFSRAPRPLTTLRHLHRLHTRFDTVSLVLIHFTPLHTPRGRAQAFLLPLSTVLTSLSAISWTGMIQAEFAPLRLRYRRTGVCSRYLCFTVPQDAGKRGTPPSACPSGVSPSHFNSDVPALATYRYPAGTARQRLPSTYHFMKGRAGCILTPALAPISRIWIFISTLPVGMYSSTPRVLCLRSRWTTSAAQRLGGGHRTDAF